MRLLNEIQQKLKVPKQSNPNVKYKSRSAEDIVEMVKPLLADKGILILSDEIVNTGDRYYIKATVRITSFEETEGDYAVEVTAYAREADTSPMMSPAQVTGATSSYARKYALNGLFAIDDTQDDDTREHMPMVQTTNTEYRPNNKPLNNGDIVTTDFEL